MPLYHILYIVFDVVYFRKKGGSGLTGAAVPSFRGTTPTGRIPVTLSPYIWDPDTDGKLSCPSRIDSVLARTLSFAADETLVNVLISGAKALFLTDASDWQQDELSGGLTCGGVRLFLGLLSKAGFQSMTSLWGTQGKPVTLAQFRDDVNAKKNCDLPLAILLKRDDDAQLESTQTWTTIVTSGRLSYTPSQNSAKSQKV
jgi:hypothetical protein